MREAATARNVVNVWNDLTRSQSSFNWWHRTVATQYHKAHAKNKDGSLANPGFKAVYDRAQEYLHDTSAFANDPADLAPTLLPQLKNLGDLKKRLALKKEDADALATAIFEGTLNYKRDDSGQLVASSVGDDPGVVFTPDELRTLFGFNTEQIRLYREARRATDRSLDILAAADVARLLGDILPEPMRAMISAGDLGPVQGHRQDLHQAATGQRAGRSCRGAQAPPQRNVGALAQAEGRAGRSGRPGGHTAGHHGNHGRREERAEVQAGRREVPRRAGRSEVGPTLSARSGRSTSASASFRPRATRP